MTSTFTPNLGLEVPGHGDYSAPGWDNPMDNSLRALDTSYGAYLNLTLSGGTHQLTTTEASSPVIGIGGTLSSDQYLYFPPISGTRVLQLGLALSGYTLYVQGNNGSGSYITIPPGTPNTLYTIYVYPSGVSWANSTAAGSLEVTNLTVDNNFSTNNATVAGTLSIQNLTIPGSLTVQGPAQVNGTATINALVVEYETIYGSLNCPTFYNNPNFTGNVSVGGAVNCATFWNNPTFSGNVAVNGTFTSQGTIYANNALQVTNSASVGGNVVVGNGVFVGTNGYGNNYYLATGGGNNYIQFQPQWTLNWRQSDGLLFWNTPVGAVFQLDGSGNLYLNGGLTQHSDIASKTNIAPFDADPLAIVERILPKRFTRKATPDVRELGFIAQDVQAVLPEAVRQSEEGGGLGITETSLVAVLWRAVQQLSAEVATLKARLPT